MPQYSPSDPFLRRLRWLTIAVITVLFAWHALSWADRAFQKESATPRAVTARGDLAADEKSTIELFERSRDSVVYISTSERVMDFWSRNIFTIPRGTGSGFIWDDKGHVVTNYHVIDGASEARVRLSDGKEYKASLVGASPMHDLAVLKIATGLKGHSLPVGTSHNLKVGQKVFAIGNPFGLDWTLTTGIVSALDRSLKGESGSVIEHLIQTDAAINPGNSGGPLLDSAGRLIGINTAIYSPSGASAGVGFAVPVDTVNRVVPQLIGQGKYVRPSLGIEIDQDLNEAITEQLGVKGVAILKVRSNSPAARAGFKGITINRDRTFTPGDIIIAVQGKQVETTPKLLARLDDFKAGDTVTITILRDGKQQQRSVQLQAE
ncbi:S1C family serine protease [Geobacter benzoatilyticus]|uniref:Trypsin-like peptidase domain-containing protein n=1 Tax=Geobacter benzoatilyticus TaxID=2815309 RepID=A0ABX7Q3D0_9BACT|nr:trypsin-like peptidase domain-containing protein [Geobacter benzoatilyticus]QSV45393.1 trypsin-like peptidase domain-containing protein [Geobacter benzoatilyticus]